MESNAKFLAKYPFVKGAGEFLKRLGIGVADLARQEYRPIVERAVSRVTEAVTKLRISPGTNAEMEILSFPVSLMLVAASGDQRAARRYALAESQAVYANLRSDDNQTLRRVASEFWGETEANITSSGYQLKYTRFLKNSTGMKHEKWKLVNRVVSGGMVYVTRDELCRLLSEEVRRHIEAKISSIASTDIPLKEEARTIVEAMEEHLPKGFVAPKNVETWAFPPCMLYLYNAALGGRHLGHAERFALTSFLVRVNMPIDEIVALFSHFPDFNEAMTRYQVEHIAGQTGAKTEYKPPSCRKLKTLGICRNPDELCKRTYHPLSYYERKLKVGGSAASNRP